MKPILEYLAKNLRSVFKNKKLNNIELLVFQELSVLIHDNCKSILNEQIFLIKRIRRFYKNQLIEPTFKSAKGKNVIRYKFPYSDSNKVMPLFYLKLKSKITGKVIRIDLYIFDGMIHQIMLDWPPKSIFETNNPELDKIEIVESNILYDPMDEDPFPTKTLNNLEYEKLIDIFADNYSIEGVLSSSSKEQRSALVKFYQLQFLADYLEIASQLEFITINADITILGLSNIITYMTPKEYVQVIAIIEGDGVLCLIRNKKNKLFYIQNEAHEPIELNMPFKEIIEDILKKGTRHLNNNGFGYYFDEKSNKQFGE